MTLAWHFTNATLRDGRPIPPVGETLRHEGPIVWCETGLYFSLTALGGLVHAQGPWVHRVDVNGIERQEHDKGVCTERTILWSHRCSDELLRGFARQQALSVIHLWDAPDVVRRYLETGDEALRDAARDAAVAAARAAARDAAVAAARDAARDAAWAAARDAANAELTRLILEAAERPAGEDEA